MDGFHEGNFKLINSLPLTRNGKLAVLERRRPAVESWVLEGLAKADLPPARRAQLERYKAETEGFDYLVVVEDSGPTYLFYADQVGPNKGAPVANAELRLQADWNCLVLVPDTDLMVGKRWRTLVKNDIGHLEGGGVVLL